MRRCVHAVSAGVTVTDVDGNIFYDLTGSYGVNIFGNDFYKECMQGEARAHVRSAGARAYIRHRDNVARAVRISGSTRSRSTCAARTVMQAVRLAAITPADRIWFVLPGPYHGWWGDVQPGVATRFRRTKPIRWPRCRSGRSAS